MRLSVRARTRGRYGLAVARNSRSLNHLRVVGLTPEAPGCHLTPERELPRPEGQARGGVRKRITRSKRLTMMPVASGFNTPRRPSLVRPGCPLVARSDVDRFVHIASTLHDRELPMRSIIFRSILAAATALIAACGRTDSVSPVTRPTSAPRAGSADVFGGTQVSRSIDQYVWLSCANGGAGVASWNARISTDRRRDTPRARGPNWW